MLFLLQQDISHQQDFPLHALNQQETPRIISPLAQGLLVKSVERLLTKPLIVFTEWITHSKAGGLLLNYKPW
jgi:hypothetical protein